MTGGQGVTDRAGSTSSAGSTGSAGGRQIELPEDRHAEELAFLAAYDDGPRPPGWRMTPRAVVTFVCGSGGEALVGAEGQRLVVSRKFVGDRGSSSGVW